RPSRGSGISRRRKRRHPSRASGWTPNSKPSANASPNGSRTLMSKIRLPPLTAARRAAMAERARHLTPGEAEKFKYSWYLWGHEMQQPPEGDWTTWLMLGGRGAGKTRAGAEWVRALADGERPVSPIALVGETMSEARAIMVEGVSGILSVHP